MKWMAGRKIWQRGAAAFFLSGLLCASSLLARPVLALDAEQLVPVGHTIGIKLFAEGVMVIGLAEVESYGGESATPGADCGLQVGDVSSLVPVLSDFFSLHPGFHPTLSLGIPHLTPLPFTVPY